MTTITIPNKKQKKYKEFIPTAAQKRVLEQSRKEHEKGEYITLEQLEYEMGFNGDSKE